MTVSGSSKRMAVTSGRTRPRPSDTFCFASAVSPRARLRQHRRRGRASWRPRRTRFSTSAARDAAVAQRKGEVLRHRHGVVDHRELEHLRDVALRRRQPGHVRPVEEHAALARRDQPGDDVEKRGLAAAGGPEQRIGAAVLPDVVEPLQRIVLRPARGGASRNGRRRRERFAPSPLLCRLPHAGRGSERAEGVEDEEAAGIEVDARPARRSRGRARHAPAPPSARRRNPRG